MLTLYMTHCEIHRGWTTLIVKVIRTEQGTDNLVQQMIDQQ